MGLEAEYLRLEGVPSPRRCVDASQVGRLPITSSRQERLVGSEKDGISPSNLFLSISFTDSRE
jgi:hypothetical protein